MQALLTIPYAFVASRSEFRVQICLKDDAYVYAAVSKVQNV